MGKLAISRERESYFQGKIIPQRENFPSEGKFTQFSLGGKILPQKMLGEQGVMTFAWRPGSQYDIAAMRGTGSVLASDCSAQTGRPSKKRKDVAFV